MELDWIEDFLALAALENFSRAAESRNITQPAFSRRIQMLENWVGTPLFERHPRRSALNPAGEQFRGYAETLIRNLRQARRAAIEAAGRAETALTIAATHALSFTFFPHLVRSRAPTALLGSLQLLSDSMEACEELMLRGEANFLLCHRHPQAESKLDVAQFCHLAVGEDMLVPFCAPDATGKPLWSLAEADPVVPIPYLAYAPASGLGRILEVEWKRRLVHQPLRQNVTARLAAALLTMAEDGQGIAWLPRTLAADSLSRGTLIEAGPDEFAIAVEIVIYRPVSRLTQNAEQFWQSLRQPTAAPPSARQG